MGKLEITYRDTINCRKTTLDTKTDFVCGNFTQADEQLIPCSNFVVERCLQWDTVSLKFILLGVLD